MVYQVSFDGALWHADNRVFNTELAAIRHIEQVRGCIGRIVRISKDRIEVHFDGYSRFASLAE
jgi:hypothetical protein